MLTQTPTVIPVTSTTKVHCVLAATVPPARLTEVAFAAAVAVPPQPFTKLGVPATVIPAGKLSVKLTVNGTGLGFAMVMVIVLVPFNAMLLGENALVLTGGANTVRTAVLLVVPVPPSVEDTALVVLLFTPVVVPVTFTTTEQEVLLPTVPPDRLTEPEPATAVTAPPQLLVRPLGVETTRPAGRVSVNASPVSVRLLGLLMVMVNEVDAPDGIVEAPNAFEIVGGLATVRLAVAVLPVPPLVELTLPVVLTYWPEAAPVTVTEN